MRTLGIVAIALALTVGCSKKDEGASAAASAAASASAPSASASAAPAPSDSVAPLASAAPAGGADLADVGQTEQLLQSIIQAASNTPGIDQAKVAELQKTLPRGVTMMVSPGAGGAVKAVRGRMPSSL